MIFSRRKKRDLDVGLTEAERARKESVGDLHSAVLAGAEVTEVADEHRRIQKRNHFAEIVRDAYRGGATA